VPRSSVAVLRGGAGSGWYGSPIATPHQSPASRRTLVSSRRTARTVTGIAGSPMPRGASATAVANTILQVQHGDQRVPQNPHVLREKDPDHHPSKRANYRMSQSLARTSHRPPCQADSPGEALRAGQPSSSPSSKASDCAGLPAGNQAATCRPGRPGREVGAGHGCKLEGSAGVFHQPSKLVVRGSIPVAGPAHWRFSVCYSVDHQPITL
jgi:hypothetical protein